MHLLASLRRDVEAKAIRGTAGARVPVADAHPGRRRPLATIGSLTYASVRESDGSSSGWVPLVLRKGAEG